MTSTRKVVFKTFFWNVYSFVVSESQTKYDACFKNVVFFLKPTFIHLIHFVKYVVPRVPKDVL